MCSLKSAQLLPFFALGGLIKARTGITLFSVAIMHFVLSYLIAWRTSVLENKLYYVDSYFYKNDLLAIVFFFEILFSQNHEIIK